MENRTTYQTRLWGNNALSSLLGRLSNISVLTTVMLCATLLGCSDRHPEKNGKNSDEQCADITVDSSHKFTMLPCSFTGIDFRNDINDIEKYTPLNNYYIYNGGGVAIGDIDNDGLVDLLFSSNQNGCRLYKNLGEFKFEAITQEAGIHYPESWTTGVCMVDVNSDGWLDLYICRSGLTNDANRANLLFMNNADGTFTEQAGLYGLDDQGSSTQAYFFDLDLDGDLDAYVLNHPLDFENSCDPIFQVKPLKDSIYSNRFYLNEDGVFKEANTKLGVGMEKGFSLSASIGDINSDGWPDVYVANDFISPDYYYINQSGRGFADSLTHVLDKTTLFSMGSDLVDVNNDGYLDLFVAEMQPEDHFRRKNNTFSLDKPFYDLIKNRFSYSQYSRNMFYTGSGSGFKEIGHLAGISMTDWSWTGLFEDLDNDGYKDLFIANGTKRDLNDLDYNGLRFDQLTVKSPKRHDTTQMILNMPISLIPIYAYRNDRAGLFEDVSDSWGLNTKLNGQGAAIADLNNDGQLDVVVNYSDAPAGVYRNNGDTSNHYLGIELTYKNENRKGIGSRVEVWTDGMMQLKYQYPNRGFQSSMPYRLHFGVEKNTSIDSVVVTWPDAQLQVETNVKWNHILRVEYNPNARRLDPERVQKLYTSTVLKSIIHVENDFDEIQRDRIVPFGLSKSGPAIASADLNGDGTTDLILGSSIGTEVQVFFRNNQGKFELSSNRFSQTIDRETTALNTLDIDNDGDLDLYLGNGSNERSGYTDQLQDQIYINDGKGHFHLDKNRIPELLLDTRCVAVYDVNDDGTADVFVGGGFEPGVYGKSSGSRILLNLNGRLVDATPELAPQLIDLGAIHSAYFAEMNNDGSIQLITAGHWESIRSFEVKSGRWDEKKPIYEKNGLWNELFIEDLNGDGKLDLIAGNHGLNTIFKASQSRPLELFLTDLDNNGTLDPIVTHYLDGVRGTFVGKDDFCEQMPDLNNKYLTYRQFAEASVQEILKGKTGSDLTHRKVEELKTVILFNNGDGSFTEQKLPIDAQYAPVKAISIQNVIGDSLPEILLFGNSDSEFYSQRSIFANHGCVLHWSESGEYVTLPDNLTGIDVRGVVSSCVGVTSKKETSIVLGRNNQSAIMLTPR
jgi:hypothetical protein